MNLNQIARELAEQLETWLDTPNDATAGLNELRGKLQALGGAIGKKAASDALRALHGSERDIRRSRQRKAAERLVEAVRPLGINLSALAPPKRQRKSAKPAGPQPAEQARAPASVGGITPPVAPEPPEERDGGFLRRAQ